MAVNLNAKYIRHRRFTRLRRGRKMKAFLAAEVTALAASATGKTLTPVRTTNTKAEGLVAFAGQPSANDTLTIGNITFTFKSALTEIFAAQTLTNDGTNVTNADTVTIDGVVYTFKTALTEAKATGTLTNDATNVTNADTVTIDGVVYTFKTTLTEVKATGTLTNDGTNVSNGDTVTIGNKTYTFQTSLTNVDGNVKIGAANTNSMTNLFEAITGGANSGVDYAAATVVHTQVTATNPTGTTVVVTSKTPGTAGNAFATTETSTHLSFGGATLAGGVNAVLNEVKIGAANTNSMTNLFEAINAGANAGTDYATGTVAHATVVATNPSGTTVVLTAKTVGTAGNAIATTETSTHLSFGGATLSGGVAAVAREVKIGAANTNSMTSLFEAINAGANVGTDYSTGTTAHGTVTATNPSGTTVVVTAKTSGTAGNAIATTETSSHLAFGAATLAGGVAAVANQVLIDDTAAHTRDNAMNAINGGAGVSTKYSTGTTPQPLVVASAQSADLLLTAASTVSLSRGKDIKVTKSAVNLTAPPGGQLDGPAWTATAHGFLDGTGPYKVTNSGGALPTGTPTTQLWLHKIDANTIALATSQQALKNGNYIQTTSAGTGTQTITRDVTTAGIFDSLKRAKPRTMRAATDIDTL